MLSLFRLNSAKNLPSLIHRGDFIHFSLHQRKRQVDSFLRLVFDNVLSTMNENEKYSESIIDFSLQESCIKSFIFRIGASLLDMQLK